MSASRSLIVLGATVLGVTVTAMLGRWQLARAQEKIDLQQTMQTRAAMPALLNDQLPCTQPGVSAQLQRPVKLRGRWLAEHTLWLDNRPMSGRAGLLVLTPLQLLDEPQAACQARVILVQRGWVPRDFIDRARVLPVPTSADVVEVPGRLVAAPSRLLELGSPGSAAQGRIRQNVDLAELSRQWGVAMLPGTVQQTADELPVPPGGTGLKREWWRPGADVGRHQAYAAQWFALAALMAGLYLWFQWWRPRRGHA